MLTRRELFKRIWLAPAALLALPQEVKAKRDKKKKRKKRVLRATIPSMAGVPSGSYVIPNTRTTTDNFTLEYDNGGYTTIAADQYRVAPFSGYVVKRSTDDSGTDVDWSTYLDYPIYWTGNIALAAGGRFPVTRELLAFEEVALTNPIDNEGAIDLELAYNTVVDFLIVGGADVVVNDTGIAIFSPTAGYDDLNAYKFIDSDGNVLGGLYSYHATDNNMNLSVGNSALQQSTSFNAGASAPAAYLARATISAQASAPTTQAGITLYADGSQSPVYNAILMQIASSDAFNVTALSDGVGAKIYGKLLQIATSKTPSSAADTGNAGEICWDSNYIYVCTASNTWKRVAIATW